MDRFHLSKGSRSRFAAKGLRDFLEYRDLGVADATGGRWRATLSHSRVDMPGGTGVHRHDLDVQLVYVLNGQATFEYAQFGPVTAIPGDCIYQPPGITHQQTDRSRDCVVLEVVSPAAFDTVDAAIEPYVEPRVESGDGAVQRFSVVHAAETPYSPHPHRPWLVRRDLGIAAATGGRVNAHLSRCERPQPGPTGMHRHGADFHLTFVLQGHCRVEFAGHGVHTLIPGDCVYQPRGVAHDVLERSDDCEFLEITSPAEFEIEPAG